MTVSPRYDQYKDAWDTSVSVEVTFFFFLGSRVSIIINLENRNYSSLMIYNFTCFIILFLLVDQSWR